MVGIVVVSHSAELARGVVALAREMGGEEIALEEAGGLDDGSIGTDAERVRAAIERAMSDDGVLVLMDLGSALMSTEMAIELMEGDGRVVMSEAPLVEGAVAAAAAARGGATLEEVRAEAQGALQMKVAQLGGEEPAADADGPTADVELAPADAQARIPVVNAIGLHARPAALVVELAAHFDADLRLTKAGGSGGPVSARSLTGLMTLAARKGDELVATAAGPQASAAVSALEQLAAGGFGEGVADGAAPAATDARPTAPAAPATVAAPVPADAPAPGTTLTGIAASTGIVLGPVRHLDRPSGPPPERESEGEDAELARLDAARADARGAIARDRDQVSGRGAASEAEIFNAHLALLEDDALLARARELIASGSAAEAAWHDAAAETAEQLRALDDPLLAGRAVDVEDVGARVVAALTGTGPALALEGVIVGEELTPRETAALDPQLVKAIATARGTPTAHAAILARALGLPGVVGLGPAVLAIPEGTPVLLDGDEGTVLVAPDEQVEAAARERAARAATRRRAAREHATESAAMRDGTVIEVAANIARQRRGGQSGGAGRRRRRAAADRVPVPGAPGDPVRGRTGTDARRDRRRAGRPPVDRAHARRRRRQAVAGGADGTRGQPVPRPSRTAPRARAPGAARGAAAGDLPGSGAAPTAGDVPDGRGPRGTRHGSGGARARAR